MSCRKQTPSHGSKQRCLYDKGHTETGEILWNSSEPTEGKQSIVQKLSSSPEKWKPCIFSDSNWGELYVVCDFKQFKTVICFLKDTWYIWNDLESFWN